MISEKNYYIHFELKSIHTENKPGKLIDLNFKRICRELNLQFQLSKCFYLNDLNSYSSRGKHSNLNCTEILICMNGTFDIKLNNGEDFVIIHMKKNNGIFIDKNIWIDIYNFKDSIIAGFVDIDFDENKNSCYDFEEYINSFK